MILFVQSYSKMMSMAAHKMSARCDVATARNISLVKFPGWLYTYEQFFLFKK
jgi:hypothetical protein